MFDFIASFYPIAFLLSTCWLLQWIYANHKHTQKTLVWQRVFGFGFVIYLLSVFLSDASLVFKLSILCRDFLVMSGAGFLFQAFLRKRTVFIIGTLLLAAGLFWFFNAKVKTTFDEAARTELRKKVWNDRVNEFSQKLTLDENGELLMEIKEKASLDKLSDELQQYGLTIERAFYPENADQTNLDNYYVVNVPNDKLNLLGNIEQALYKSGVVEWVEENEVINVSPTPTNPVQPINNRFGINDPGLSQLWGFEAMGVDKLYNHLNDNKLQPKRKALIAILDTGVDGEHEDLKGNFKSTKNQYDNDPVGHGTHCAGIAAAVSNNGIGVASFSTDNRFVEVTSIKVLNAMGSGTQQSIIKGMVEAGDRKADVVSMSLGGFSDRFKIKAYTDAVNYITKAGGIVVAAAGNSNRNAKDYSPVNTPGVIGVSAIDRDLNRAVFSNYVSDIKMGVAAPGVGIYSTIPNNKYNTFNGTSMATPYVAGLVGLMKSIKPDLTAEQAYYILNKTGKSTKATSETGKLINPVEALKQLR